MEPNAMKQKTHLSAIFFVLIFFSISIYYGYGFYLRFPKRASLYNAFDDLLVIIQYLSFIGSALAAKRKNFLRFLLFFSFAMVYHILFVDTLNYIYANPISNFINNIFFRLNYSSRLLLVTKGYGYNIILYYISTIIVYILAAIPLIVYTAVGLIAFNKLVGNLLIKKYNTLLVVCSYTVFHLYISNITNNKPCTLLLTILFSTLWIWTIYKYRESYRIQKSLFLIFGCLLIFYAAQVIMYLVFDGIYIDFPYFFVNRTILILGPLYYQHISLFPFFAAFSPINIAELIGIMILTLYPLYHLMSLSKSASKWLYMRKRL